MSAQEARTITRIERQRLHRELAPHGVTVICRWKPALTVAEIRNGGPNDFEVRIAHYFASGAGTTPTIRRLLAGTMLPIPLGRLEVPELQANADGWTELRRIYANDERRIGQLADALARSDIIGGHLAIMYRRVGACECGITPPSGEYGHWVTIHRIEELVF